MPQGFISFLNRFHSWSGKVIGRWRLRPLRKKVMARRQRNRGNAAIEVPPADPKIDDVTLADATRARYLNYALSVITSRALPDVRDGLKPVQRRILYAMGADLNIKSDGRYVK